MRNARFRAANGSTSVRLFTRGFICRPSSIAYTDCGSIFLSLSLSLLSFSLSFFLSLCLYLFLPLSATSQKMGFKEKPLYAWCIARVYQPTKRLDLEIRRQSVGLNWTLLLAADRSYCDCRFGDAPNFEA